MSRLLAKMSLCGTLLGLVSCSVREKQIDSDAQEWAEIQAIADKTDETKTVDLETNESFAAEDVEAISSNEFEKFIERLKQMKVIRRQDGETLLTGKSLVFDQDNHYMRMERDVVIKDDQGTLKMQHLTARFSISNEVEYIEAGDGVYFMGDRRTASADEAVYNHQEGTIQLIGKAAVSDADRRLSGERIALWNRNGRKVLCERDALLEIGKTSGLQFKEIPKEAVEEMEIRADRMVYDESEKTAELTGNVRLQNPQATMNCEHLRLSLKEDHDVDWIKASGGVILQFDDRRMLAEHATYYADEGKFTLTGQPMVSQGRNVMTGDRMIFWHKTRRMVCEPNARMQLYPDEEIKAKFLNELNQ